MSQTRELEIITRADLSWRVIVGKGAFIVDIWADWCGPCRMLTPFLHKIAAEFDGRVTVVKLLYDGNRDMKESYGFQGIPTLLFYNDGELVSMKSGYGGYAYLRSSVDEFVAKITGEPTPEATAAEQAFIAAAAAADADYNKARLPLVETYMAVYKPLKRNFQQTKKRTEKALAAGKIDEAESKLRIERANTKLNKAMEPAHEVFDNANTPIEAAFVAAIEAASGVFGHGHSSETSGGFCAIGDPTCRV
jgi:thioredoxin 1